MKNALHFSNFRIEAALKRDGSTITGIFLRVDAPDEISPEERYQVIMRLTAREEVFEEIETEIRALDLTELIRQEFNGIDGIEIADYALVSEADFSLADLRATMRCGITITSAIGREQSMTCSQPASERVIRRQEGSAGQGIHPTRGM